MDALANGWVWGMDALANGWVGSMDVIMVRAWMASQSGCDADLSDRESGANEGDRPQYWY